MLDAETIAEIRSLHYAEHWKIGTIVDVIVHDRNSTAHQILQAYCARIKPHYLALAGRQSDVLGRSP